VTAVYYNNNQAEEIIYIFENKNERKKRK